MHRVFLILFFLFSSCFADTLIIEPDAGPAPLLSEIKNAGTSIDLAMYGFTDESFMKALISEKNKGKKINILLEPLPYKYNNENARAIRIFTIANIKVNFPSQRFNLLHQKTFIIDRKKAIVLTFNLTHASFSNERNFGLIVTDPAEVEEISHTFENDINAFNTPQNQANLVWSPDNSREKVLELINSAHQEIKIYAQNITDYQLIGELAKAARKGIRVEILLSRKDSKSGKLAYLKKAGIKIYSPRQYYIHAKVIIIDQECALLGSINLTKPSLDMNRELSIITHDRTVVHQLNETFDKDKLDHKKNGTLISLRKT